MNMKTMTMEELQGVNGGDRLIGGGVDDKYGNYLVYERADKSRYRVIIGWEDVPVSPR